MPVIAPACDRVIRVRGTVQGVGFRPFVHRVATRLGLGGWVRNDPQGVLIRLAGDRDKFDAFEDALRRELPPAAHILTMTEEEPELGLPAAGAEFVIVESVRTGPAAASLPPDLAICAECRAELFAPTDRRFRYPFINCTQCGPRYSIIETLPYDRPGTTMRAFRMCAACAAEYGDPANRRFHAQPNACAHCGPAVRLSRADGHEVAQGEAAIRAAAQEIVNGAVVAVKGIGGYHLVVDATKSAAVAELRRRKHRDEKPLAVMFADLAAVEACGEVSAEAAERLSSPSAPIVLVPRRAGAELAPEIAPGNPWLGAFLAYSPLHLLLLAAVGRPLVATSGNLAEEPLCIDNQEAHERLGVVADAFLDHDRPIAHPVDDSVVRLAESGPVVLRRARGYAPTPLLLPAEMEGNWLCVGAQMKNTVAIAAGDCVVLSPHIGDLGSVPTTGVFSRTSEMLAALHRRPFTAVACDKHPDYASTRFAESLGLPRLPVQHHLAHVLACLLEHRHVAGDVLGVSWDGTGYGEDGTIWGGEFILLRDHQAVRFGRLRRFRLLGGDAAVRAPSRVALSLLAAANSDRLHETANQIGFGGDELATLVAMHERGINAPWTSSVGRLFDGVGALLGLGRQNRFEGQTAFAVENAAMLARSSKRQEFSLPVVDLPRGSGACCELDWRPMIAAIAEQRRRGGENAVAARAFHHALAEATVGVARRAGAGTVALSGGCFQNALLLDLTVSALRAAHFEVLTHRELPPNDGNIAAGQALAALWNVGSVELP